jgi:hypothetical protein
MKRSGRTEIFKTYLAIVFSGHLAAWDTAGTRSSIFHKLIKKTGLAR